MTKIFSHDIQSVTGRNLANIGTEFNLDPRRDPAAAFKTKMIGYVTPEVDEWRLPLLSKLLDQRSDFHSFEEDTSTLDGLTESLCESGTHTICMISITKHQQKTHCDNCYCKTSNER